MSVSFIPETIKSDEPTTQLRWRDGVLQQAHRIVTYSGSLPIAEEIQWWNVPGDPPQ